MIISLAMTLMLKLSTIPYWHVIINDDVCNYNVREGTKSALRISLSD